MFRRYWLEILTFGTIGSVMLLCLAPDATWINVDSDGMHLVYAAKYLVPAHKGSAPVYLLLGHLFLYLPIGTEFWRLGLLSVVGGVVSAVFVYLIILNELRLKPNVRYFSLIGALVFGGAALVLAQATVVKYYTFVSVFMLAAYYFALKGRWKWTAVMMGLGGATHPIALCTIIPLLVRFKPLRAWKNLALAGSFVLFYLYVPLTNRPPYVWDMPGAGGAFGFIKDTVQTAAQLNGGLSIWDFPKRILDTVSQMGVSLAVLGFVPLGYYFWRQKVTHSVLFWMMILPVMVYATDLAPQVMTYMVPSVAFAAVAVGLGLAQMSRRWAFAVALCAIGFLAFNANYFDIGRTLDAKLSAAEYYNKELPKVPDGQILLTRYGWEWAGVFDYNVNEGRHILPLFSGQLIGAAYRKTWLDAYGIKYEVPRGKSPDEDWVYADEAQVALSVIRLNPNVWVTEISDPRTYGLRVVKAHNGTIADLEAMDTRLKAPINPQWQFKPSNPYDVITGSVEVQEWGYPLISNWNVMFFAGLGATGIILNWLVSFPSRRRKVHETV